MNKSNFNKWRATKRPDPFPPEVKYQCPVCKSRVLSDDFITSYRLVEDALIEDSPQLVYEIVNLCRKCRDSQLNSDV